MASSSTIRSPYTAVSVTVPNDGAPHQLLALILAVEPAAHSRCHYLTIQNDVDNSNGKILIGEGNKDSSGATNATVVSSTNYGAKLEVGGSEAYIGFKQEDFEISRFWVQASGGSVQLNVQMVRG